MSSDADELRDALERLLFEHKQEQSRGELSAISVWLGSFFAVVAMVALGVLFGLLVL